MNDEVIEPVEGEAVNEPALPPVQLVQSNDIDWHLANLVALTNRIPGVSIGITLTIGGTLVSGLLISGKEYFDSLALELSKDSENTLSMAIAEEMKNISNSIYDSNLERGHVSTVYIHLKKARHYTGDKSIPNDGAYWRGKLCDVSGFTFGSLNKD
ncbi:MULTISPECIES: gas vesicle accessory protein GvpU [Aeromonas]|uniref:gas vesicle accessory protein GvpU n=1 Tax=Aeromonas TaxID=642 RepID=UPI002B45A53E|nr:gas vesicle accessory protein GvpU [Aeromonas caviae]